jgi:lipooligosaccharide transport system ATP-binding protein
MVIKMDVVVAENLVKEYNGFKAVKGINFTVREKECFGLLGPNGAGKSSTISMLYGYSPVTAGRLLVLGMDVSLEQRRVKHCLGVVPQENNLDPELKVLQNLLIYASYFGIPKPDARSRALKLLEFFGLEGKAEAKVDSLSGGMKRKLIIARAMMNNPEIILLDEPTTGLDPQARHLVWQRLRGLKDMGVTLILTTHYMEEASQLCDRLVIMDQGKILEEGEPYALVSRHIGRDVVEIGNGAMLLDDLMDSVGPMIRGHLVVGENLFFYPYDGQALVKALNDLPILFSHQLLRPATLEDVFLKLTGRVLA